MYLRLGWVGALGCGKGSATDHLKGLNFEVHAVSLSDLLRQDLVAKEIVPSRHTLRDHARAIRQKQADILVQRALALLACHTTGIVVIDGIRNMAELRSFQVSHPDAYAIGFPADPEIRFERTTRRRRPEDPTEDELRAIMTEEMTPGPDWGFQLPACLAAVDFTVDADLPLEAANRQLTAILEEIMSGAHNKERATST